YPRHPAFPGLVFEVSVSGNRSREGLHSPDHGSTTNSGAPMTRSIRTARTTGILTALVLAGAGLVAAPAAGAPGGDVVATAADPAGGRTFYNPIKTGADPSIYLHDGEYVFAESVNDQGIALRRSATLTGLGSAARQVVWTAPPTG